MLAYTHQRIHGDVQCVLIFLLRNTVLHHILLINIDCHGQQATNDILQHFWPMSG
uniref:Uncharacterized protein n=1 Tax=Arion vulgaris TaxID=1028688 RepID=A0A0B6YRW0_9EUPU